MSNLTEILKKREFNNLFKFELHPGNTTLLDLSKSNDEKAFKDIQSVSDFEDYIREKLANTGKEFAYGGYGENRAIYSRFTHFNDGSSAERHFHLGVDIWCPAREKVHAPLEGTIHSFANNDSPGDYGGTIILEHELEGTKFHTLYGHLSQDSLENKETGQHIAAGEGFAELGEEHENVGWPPHLHFQIIKDMEGKKGDYPGVASEEDKDKFLENCPNPNLMLQLAL